MYIIESKGEELHFVLFQDMKRYEALLRGLKKDYSITYPDGYKIKCQYENTKKL